MGGKGKITGAYDFRMITCLYCGTNHEQFQSNCKNCGSPLPRLEEQAKISEVVNAPDDVVPEAPPAPREISNRYVWRLLLSDAWGITALVFLILGIVFLPVGITLILGIVTAFVGIPFAGMGMMFVGGGAAVGHWRYQEKQKVVEVLRNGLQTTGEILDVKQNYNVTVNGRNPWNITYSFSIDGQDYQGKVTTLNTPGPGLQPGRNARVLYLQEAPTHNVIFPHP